MHASSRWASSTYMTSHTPTIGYDWQEGWLTHTFSTVLVFGFLHHIQDWTQWFPDHRAKAFPLQHLKAQFLVSLVNRNQKGETERSLKTMRSCLLLNESVLHCWKKIHPSGKNSRLVHWLSRVFVIIWIRKKKKSLCFLVMLLHYNLAGMHSMSNLLGTLY